MEIKNQQKVWNKIAPDWNEFRNKPTEGVLPFLKKQKGKILDLGCGSGRNLVKTGEGKMYLVDFSKKMIEFAKKKAKEKNIDAEFFVAKSEKLPFENNFFDAGICIAVLHCIETKSKREKTIKELFRVLKPGAKAKISVWNKNSPWFKKSKKEKYMQWRDKGKRYLYLYDKKEIHDLFKKIGFEIVKKFEPKRNITFIIRKPLVQNNNF